MDSVLVKKTINYFYLIIIVIMISLGMIDWFHPAFYGNPLEDSFYIKSIFFMIGIFAVNFGMDVITGKKDEEDRIIYRIKNEINKSYYPVECINDLSKVFKALERDINEAKKEILIISWSDIGGDEYEDFAKKMHEAFRLRIEKKDLEIKRLFWRSEHIDFLKNHQEIYDKKDKVQIHCHSGNINNETPIMPCIIIDGIKFHWGLGYLGKLRVNSMSFVGYLPELVTAYKDYFDVLWSEADPIKLRNNKINWEAVEKISFKE